MILVDTSVWIEFLIEPQRVPEAAARIQEFVICGPIIQELTQGFADSDSLGEFQDRLLALPRLSDPVGTDLFLKAGEIYRDGRRRGYTIRSPYDCLIAAIAIEHNVTLWHRDRDYEAIARYTPLKVLSERLH